MDFSHWLHLMLFVLVIRSEEKHLREFNPDEDLLFFLHAPKTGGMSLSLLLRFKLGVKKVTSFQGNCISVSRIR